MKGRSSAYISNNHVLERERERERERELNRAVYSGRGFMSVLERERESVCVYVWQEK